jgi:hypothetical protein
MAAPGMDPTGGGSPDDLLMQIRDLLDQYLALGGDTPVAPEAMQLAQAIDQSVGGGAPDQGGAPPPPPDAGAMPPPPGGMPPGGDMPPDPGGMPDIGGQSLGLPGYGGGDFGGASQALLEDLKKKKSKG